MPAATGIPDGVSPSVSTSGSGRFSCVVDAHPRFHLDALRWFATLTESAGVDAADLVVHVVGPDSTDALNYLRKRGVAVRTIEPFDARSPHCNKIAGALQLAADRVDGMAVLCDTDIVVLEDPRQVEIPPGAIAGKPVDAPVPPLEVILAIFEAAGVDPPGMVPLPWGEDQTTVQGNNNGGLYLIPGALLAQVATSWARWARWLLDRSEMLGTFSIYVDQVSMALGLAAEGIGSMPLGVRWNTPTHDPSRIPDDAPSPAILHYHQEVEENGLVALTGTPSIDERIIIANQAVSSVWRLAAPAAAHRQWLLDRPPRVAPDSALGPQVDTTGSGPATVTALLKALGPASILEVGCRRHDQWADQVAPVEFIGIDPSVEVIDQARASGPQGTYLVGSLNEHPDAAADVVVCLDPGGDHSEPTTQSRLLDQLWRSTGRALVLSSGTALAAAIPPGQDAHGPLLAAMAAVAPEAEIYPVSDSGDGSETLVALRPPSERHPRDYLPATLAPLVHRHPDPMSLLAIRVHAWDTLRFYPDHAPRLWEYPVVTSLISDHLPPGSRLVDVGAGVTPLAPFLTRQGFQIDTVDPSEIRRTWPPQPDWNEWDYLDYGRAGLAHRSWNCTLDKTPRRPLFDGAYSISVIEHIPAEDRRRLLAEMAARVRAGGLVVLTIDLVRGSDILWNRNRGVEVEDPRVHGTFDDIVAECAAVGLELFQRETVRQWGDVEVDIGLMAMHRTEAALPGRVRRLGRRMTARAGH